jgi:dihydroorotase
MPNNKVPISTLSRLDEKLKIAAKKAVCDYQLLFGATKDNQKQAVKAARKIAGLKIYFGSSTGDLLLYETETVLRHFRGFPKNRTITVHAEDERVIRFYSGTSTWQHHLNRPELAAVSAVTKVIDFARVAKRNAHIAHFSTSAELELVKEAKSEGLDVTCEITPHHLFLNKSFHLKKKNLGKMNPPLREEEDLEKIWKNFQYIDAVATDHAPHTLEEKLRSYLNSPSGVVGMETALPLLLTAYHEGRLKLQDVAIKYAQNPAKIYQLENKGKIEKGFDADFCLVDLNKSYVIRNKDLKSKCGWTPFDGRLVKGKVVSTILRGRLVYQDGKILVPQGFGRLVPLS